MPNSKERKRVESAIQYISSRIPGNYLFILYEIKKEEKEALEERDLDCGIMECSRTARGAHDKPTFMLYYDPEQTIPLSVKDLRRVVFHEIIHILTFDYADEIESLLDLITNKKLKEELSKRAQAVNENVTYRLERSLGPLCFPNLNWSSP
jgi:hypothetical protein